MREQQSKRIVLICGHPDSDSFSGFLLTEYQEAAEAAGHEVVRFNLGEMDFDPILHKGYKEIQPLEEDLITLQTAISECDHLVIAYPNWWCSLPALLKGMFDRIWLPGFAFDFDNNSNKVIKYLVGKTARIYSLSGSNTPLQTWWKYGDYTNEIQYAILEFAGIKTKVSAYGPCSKVSDKTREKWLNEVKKHGQKGV